MVDIARSFASSGSHPTAIPFLRRHPEGMLPVEVELPALLFAAGLAVAEAVEFAWAFGFFTLCSIKIELGLVQVGFE